MCERVRVYAGAGPCNSSTPFLLQVNRAYRKLSLCCHPDKSSHPDAPRAFEALKKAKAVLTHPLDKDDYLRDFVKDSKIAWEGSWNGADSVFAEKERMSKMREDAQTMQGESVADAMRERCVASAAHAPSASCCATRRQGLDCPLPNPCCRTARSSGCVTCAGLSQTRAGAGVGGEGAETKGAAGARRGARARGREGGAARGEGGPGR